MLRHFMRREGSGPPVGSAAWPGVSEQPAAPFLAAVHLELLTKTLKEIAESEVFLQQLCSSIAIFTDLAPADVSPIHLT
jgi:hypothetical protein